VTVTTILMSQNISNSNKCCFFFFSLSFYLFILTKKLDHSFHKNIKQKKTFLTGNNQKCFSSRKSSY